MNELTRKNKLERDSFNQLNHTCAMDAISPRINGVAIEFLHSIHPCKFPSTSEDEACFKRAFVDVIASKTAVIAAREFDKAIQLTRSLRHAALEGDDTTPAQRTCASGLHNLVGASAADSGVAAGSEDGVREVALADEARVLALLHLSDQ